MGVPDGVSILARPEGRALPKTAFVSPFEIFVSILARPEGRALLGYSMLTAASSTFQSSPAPKGGRYLTTCRLLLLCSGVSILARPEGRALRSSGKVCSPICAFQSSPAPKGGRYVALERCVRQFVRFNPRPPRRAGATSGDSGRDGMSDVSILARPEGRALPQVKTRVRVFFVVSILARPEGRALPVLLD